MNNLYENRPFIIGNCADLVKEEDQGSLIKAVRKLVAREVPVQLILTGDGPLREDLKKLARRFHVDRHVHFCYPQMTEEELLNRSDVLVFCGFEVKDLRCLQRALRAGVTVIATNIPPHRHLIEEGKNGFLVPCGFPERIEAVIKRLEVKLRADLTHMRR